MLKYEMIAHDVQGKIARGEYKANQRLPVMSELCEMYGVSKITVKRAMDMLVARGLVIKRRGSGSFVKNISITEVAPPFQDMSKQLLGFTSEYTDTGIHVSTVVHEFEVIEADEDVADQLRIRPGDFVYHIVRTRLAEDVPQEIEYTFMPITIVPGLSADDVRTSVYAYVRDKLDLKIYSAHRSIRAVMPTEEEHDRLQLGESDPLLEISQVVFLDDGRIFEYSVCRHVGSRFTFYSISNN